MAICETSERAYAVFVGSETGLLKGLSCKSSVWENLNNVSKANRHNEITSLLWNDVDQTQIAVGRRSKKIDFYDLVEKTWYHSLSCGVDPNDKSTLKCLARLHSHFITGYSDGIVKVWSEENEQISIKTGNSLFCMDQQTTTQNLILTGGKENDAKLWDLNNSDKCVFSAKNVRNDWLDLRVPVWVRGVSFLPDSQKFVTCTAYHQIRLYDPGSGQRRPVLDAKFGTLPLISIAVLPSGHQVAVGNSHGDMGLIDLRKGFLTQGYKGNAGAVRCIKPHPTESALGACGLDRYFRFYDVRSGALLHKVYLKSRLNCFLFRNEPFDIKVQHDSYGVSTDVSYKNSESEPDDIWDTLETVDKPKRKRKPKFVTSTSIATVTQSKIIKSK